MADVYEDGFKMESGIIACEAGTFSVFCLLEVEDFLIEMEALFLGC